MTIWEQVEYIEKLVYIYMDDRRCSREELATTPIPYMQAWLEMRNKFNAAARGSIPQQQRGAIPASGGKYDDWSRTDGKRVTRNVHFSTIMDNIDNPAYLNNLTKGL